MHVVRLAFLASLIAVAGCAHERRAQPLTATPSTASAETVSATPTAPSPWAASHPSAPEQADQTVRTDPWAYLRRVHATCRNLEQYRLLLTRTERRGLGPFKTLQGPEQIACRFRRAPLSIYFEWLDPAGKHGVAVYVEGVEDDRVRFVPRRGAFGLKPRLSRVPLWMPVYWGESKYPITDFGLERVIGLLLEAADAATRPVELEYQGVEEFEPTGQRVHRFHLTFPLDEFPTPLQDLYIGVDSDLPVSTRVHRRDGRLEAEYIWDEIETDVSLTDDDFVLPQERESVDPLDG